MNTLLDRPFPIDAGPSFAKYMMETDSVLVLLFRRDGTVIWYNKKAGALLGTAHINQGISGIFVDFTGLANIGKWAETEAPCLRSLNTASGMPVSYIFRFYKQNDYIIAMGECDCEKSDQLGSTMVELYQDLSNVTRELHRKNAELKQLNNLKNEFLGMAAHDMRSPIGNIQTLAGFLREDLSDTLSAEHNEFINTIIELSDFMLEMLGELLDITAIESGKLQLHLEHARIDKVVESAIALNQRHAADKKISILWTRVPETPDSMLMDPRKILQCINNLISNAVKYSPLNSTIRITVKTTASTCRIHVFDQGPGLKPEDCHNLFQPFHCLQTRPTGGETATGLGLAIVQKIITAHQGTAGVDSSVGHGSCFWIELPRDPSNTF